jgi:hypothetical protein
MSEVVSRRMALQAGLLVPSLLAKQADARSSSLVCSLSDALRLLDRSDAVVRVCAGDHRIENPQIREGLSGKLVFEPGARLIAVNRDAGGLRFVNCNRLTIEGLDLLWSGPAVTRSHFGAGVLFVACGDTALIGCRVFGAPGAGVHFDVCHTVRVETAYVESSGADGVHFANCRQVRASRLTTVETGDDGVACVDYESKPQGSDIELSGIHVRGSRARGIAVVGTARVQVSGFRVDQTASSGVLIAQDFHYKTRRPEAVVLRDGVVVAGGRREPPAGNQFGIEVNHATSVYLSDIEVTDPKSRGVSVVNTRGEVRLSALRLHCAALGVPALECRLSEQVRLDRISVSGGAALAMLFEDCEQLRLESASVMTAANEPELTAARFGRIRDARIGSMRIDGPGRAIVQVEPGVTGTLVRTLGPTAPKLINRSPTLQVEATGVNRQ